MSCSRSCSCSCYLLQTDLIEWPIFLIFRSNNNKKSMLPRIQDNTLNSISTILKPNLTLKHLLNHHSYLLGLIGFIFNTENTSMIDPTKFSLNTRILKLYTYCIVYFPIFILYHCTFSLLKFTLITCMCIYWFF